MHALEDHAVQLLFIDDEPLFRNYVLNLPLNGYRVVTAGHLEEARTLIEEHKAQPEIIFIDPVCRDRGLLDLEEICSQFRGYPIVVLSASRDPRYVVGALRAGAKDYLCKPVEAKELQRISEEILTGRSKTERSEKNDTLRGFGTPRRRQQPSCEFLFCNPAMKQIYEQCLQIADVPVPVLLQGESGVGKDVVARLIHQNSKMGNKPFVKVNCAALPAELTESELFGCERGAFTGAYIDRAGKFEFAGGGSIFLDEISEFSPSVQAKLLQVLQDRTFSRLGSNREVEVDVRVIAATNTRLEEAIEKGRFRLDLYYRLNVVKIEIPALRHRKDEIDLFSDFFLDKFSKLYNGGAPKRIPAELRELFHAYHWPGNVRELENIIKRYIVLEDVESIRSELESKMSRQAFDQIDEITESFLQSDNTMDLKEISRRAAFLVENNAIVKTLTKHNWNKWKTAKELKVSYKTLLTKIEQFGITPASQGKETVTTGG